jgi:hypothetical protein
VCAESHADSTHKDVGCNIDSFLFTYATVKKEHFEALRASLNAGKLTLFQGTLVDCLREKAEAKYTVASLLDHMDWMPPSVIPH